MNTSENNSADAGQTPTFELLRFPTGAFQTNCYVVIDASDEADKDPRGAVPPP